MENSEMRCCYEGCNSLEVFASTKNFWQEESLDKKQLINKSEQDNYCQKDFNLVRGYRKDWDIYFRLCSGGCGVWIKKTNEYCKSCVYNGNQKPKY